MFSQLRFNSSLLLASLMYKKLPNVLKSQISTWKCLSFPKLQLRHPFVVDRIPLFVSASYQNLQNNFVALYKLTSVLISGPVLCSSLFILSIFWTVFVYIIPSLWNIYFPEIISISSSMSAFVVCLIYIASSSNRNSGMNFLELYILMLLSKYFSNKKKREEWMICFGM